MATNEQERLEFSEFVRGEWGSERAGQLMELLPPAGMRDLATKTELRAEIAELRAEMHQGFGRIHEKIGDQTRTLVLAMIGTSVSGVTLAFAAARFV